MRDKIPLTAENYLYLKKKYGKDIEAFAVDLFFSPGLDKWQVEIARKFYTSPTNLFFARASGHSTGKSYFASILALHFLLFHKEVGIVVTANTRSQLLNKFGKELTIQAQKSLISNFFECTTTKVYRKKFDGKPDPVAFIELATNNPNSVESFSGLHSEAILLIADECSGLDPGIHNAIMSSTPKQTPDAIRRVVYFGNPLRSSGIFYDIFHNEKMRSYWDLGHINSLECRYSDKEFCQMLIDTYGMESSIVKTRVLGQFPDIGENNLIDSTAIDQAADRELDKLSYGREPLIMSVDVARYGDDRSVILLRQGRKVFKPDVVLSSSLTDLAMRVIAEYQRYRPDHIVIDSIGVGAGVFDILNDKGLPVVEFIASQRAQDSRTYGNLRAEMYWKLKEYIERDEPDIPKVPELLDELRMLTYKYNQRLQILIDSKEEIKKQYGRSPDLADALMLSMYSFDQFKFRKVNTVLPVKQKTFAW